MDHYLYPWYDVDGNVGIGSIKGRNYNDCLDKLTNHLIDKYEKLDDTLSFNELLDQLGEIYGVYIGDIYDINEF